MPINVEWYDENKKLIWIRFVNKWTWDDYDAAVDTIVSMYDEVDGYIDQVLDFSQTTYVAPGDIMQHIGRGINTKTAAYRLSLYVQPPTVFRRLVDLLDQTAGDYPKRFIFNTIDEAIAKIEQYNRSESK